MASSHRRHRQDKTVLPCLVGVHSVTWIGDKSRLSVTETFETVLSSLEMQCELSLVLSWPTFQFARNVVTYCDVRFGNWVKTSSQMCSHCRQDWTKLFCLQYIENCLWLSRTQFTPPTPTRQDSLVLSVSAVWTRHKRRAVMLNWCKNDELVCGRWVEGGGVWLGFTMMKWIGKLSPEAWWCVWKSVTVA